MGLADKLSDASHTMHRLTTEDHMLHLLGSLGMNSPIQLIFHLDAPLDEEHMQLVNEHIAAAGFGRVRRKSLLPGNPGYWNQTSYAPAVIIHQGILPEEEKEKWLEEQFSYIPRSSQLPRWQLSGASLEGGRSVISFVVSHHVIDGRGTIEEFIRISERINNNQPPPSRSRYTNPRSVSLTDQLVEEVKLFPKSLLTRILFTGFISVRGKTKQKIRRWVGQDLKPCPTQTYTVFLDKQSLASAAAAQGGSITTLVSASFVNVMHEIDPQSTVASTIMIPVNIRTDPNLTSNQVAYALVSVKDMAKPIRELGELKKRCKTAYEKLKEKSKAVDFTLGVLVSNAGSLPPEIGNIFPHTSHVWGRAIAQTEEHVQQIIPPGLFAVFSEYNGTICIAVTGFHFDESINVREACNKEYSNWGLTPRELDGHINNLKAYPAHK